MKIEYPIEHICSVCEKMRKTRRVQRLDIRLRVLVNHLCRKCDTSHGTTAKIYEWNQKHMLLREYDRLSLGLSEDVIGFGKWEKVQLEKEFICHKCAQQFDYEEANLQNIEPLFGCAPISCIPFCPKCYPIGEPIDVHSIIKYGIQ